MSQYQSNDRDSSCCALIREWHRPISNLGNFHLISWLPTHQLPADCLPGVIIISQGNVKTDISSIYNYKLIFGLLPCVVISKIYNEDKDHYSDKYINLRITKIVFKTRTCRSVNRRWVFTSAPIYFSILSQINLLRFSKINIGMSTQVAICPAICHPLCHNNNIFHSLIAQFMETIFVRLIDPLLHRWSCPLRLVWYYIFCPLADGSD